MNFGLNLITRHTFILLVCFLATQTAYAAKGAEGYKVQPGDVLAISVWKEEELQQEVIVRPDGGISFPLAGDLQAADKSITQITNEITKRLEKYIPDPVVSVSAQQLAGNKIYVIGQVTRPGEYQATSYLDVIQAISMAGGVTPFAAVNKIKILRRNEDGSLRVFHFKYAEVEKGDNLDQNMLLQSRDVVIVP